MPTPKTCQRIGCRHPIPERRKYYCSEYCRMAVHRGWHGSTAKKHGPKKWVPEAIEMLHNYYGMHSPAEVATRLSNAFGVEFTRTAVIYKASQLGLKAAEATGFLCIADAAREIGTTTNALSKYLRDAGLKTTGRGRHRYLPPDVYEHVKARYSPAPEPVMTVAKAARLLGLSEDAVYRWYKLGHIKGYKVGRYLEVSEAEVRRKIAERARARAHARNQEAESA